MKKHIGDLIITEENKNDFKDLVEVTGNVAAYVNFEAPKLQTVGGYVAVNVNFEAPKLETVGGAVLVDAKFEAPKLKTIGGFVDVYGFAKFKAPKLQTIGGSVSVYANFNAPNLQTIGGSVYVDADFEAPKLQTVGGYINVNVNFEAPKLETVGGAVLVDANFEAPKLQTVGGSVSVYVRANFNAPKAKEKCKDAQIKVFNSFLEKNFIFTDGILQTLISRKKINDLEVFKVKNIGTEKIGYVVRRDNKFAHGETLEKAIEDLRYKISDRDTSKFMHWRDNLNMEVTLEYAIEGYRTITGACEFGVKEFVNSINVPDVLTPNVILKLTEGKFGSDVFRKFLDEETVE